jgi:hypothetical protein
VYLSAGEVVFVFESDTVEWLVSEIVNEPFGEVAGRSGRGASSSRSATNRPAVYTWESDED